MLIIKGLLLTQASLKTVDNHHLVERNRRPGKRSPMPLLTPLYYGVTVPCVACPRAARHGGLLAPNAGAGSAVFTSIGLSQRNREAGILGT
jgi:hypothetical protein